MRLLYRWFDTNAVILVNASSLFGTRIVTSVLGFIYWGLAARLYTPKAVGLASAAISAMLLLGTIGVLGFGTLLIGELPRRPQKAGPLLTTSLVVAGTASLGLGFLFAAFARFVSHDLTPLAQNLGNMTLFTVGVALTTITLVLDQALIGLLRGNLQLHRNTIFSLVKLGAVFVTGWLLTDQLGLTIYATWAFGNLASLGYVAWASRPGPFRPGAYQPQWGLLRELKGPALRHYLLNLTLQVPGYTLPLVVTVLLSTEANAGFYVAWMLATSLFMMPQALTTVLYAVGAADTAALAEKMRFTLKFSLGIGVLGSILLLTGANLLLHFFGESYVEQASASLRILALGIFPIIIKVHFVAICQIRNRMLDAAKVMAVGGSIELILAAVGAHIGGLTGLSLGWVIAITIEGIVSLPLVYRVARPQESLSAIERTTS